MQSNPESFARIDVDVFSKMLPDDAVEVVQKVFTYITYERLFKQYEEYVESHNKPDSFWKTIFGIKKKQVESFDDYVKDCVKEYKTKEWMHCTRLGSVRAYWYNLKDFYLRMKGLQKVASSYVLLSQSDVNSINNVNDYYKSYDENRYKKYERFYSEWKDQGKYR